MKLHNEQVVKGDRVYDLMEKDGQVTVVGESEITVRFANSRSYSYNKTGKRMGNVPARLPVLLYWHNPIVVVPAKSEKIWGALKEILFSAKDTLNRI